MKMSAPNDDASTRGNITDTELVDTIFDVILNDSHVTGNESETFEEIEWEEADDEYGRSHVDFYMLSVLFPAVLFGVIINALFLALLIKSRLMKQYQVCAFLIAISVNNILDLLFQYGFHWIVLLERDHYHQLTSTDFTCRLGHFLWTFFLSAQYLMMVGFVVNRLLEQQLYEDPASTSSRDAGCCSLPRNSTWKAIATKFCSPLGTLVYVIISTVVLIIANVPNFWIYSVEYGFCAVDTSIWGYHTSYTWFVSFVTFFWLIFFVAYLVVTPLTICGFGPRPVAYFQTMFGYSAMEEDAEEEEVDQSGNFTRLSLVTSTVLWAIAIPVCSIRFSEFLNYSVSHEFSNALHNVLDVIRTFHCLYLALWPLTCLILVPTLRVEAKRICALFQQWCTCCRGHGGGIVVQMTNVAEGD